MVQIGAAPALVTPKSPLTNMPLEMATMAARYLAEHRDRFHRHYRYEYPCGPDVCTYCGDPATVTDHVIPVSYLARLVDPQIDHPRLQRGLIVVPACADCNGLLGPFVAFSIEDKRAELKRRLRRKYARLLGTAEWADDELGELGGSLRGWIKATDDRARWLWLRYTWNGLQEPRQGA